MTPRKLDSSTVRVPNEKKHYKIRGFVLLSQKSATPMFVHKPLNKLRLTMRTDVNVSGNEALWSTEGVPETPESEGAFAALSAKAERQGITQFFSDPIHIRRGLIAKREAAGADTAYGHTCSNIIEQLENLFGYVRPAWATDERQTLPYQISEQVERLAMLSADRP